MNENASLNASSRFKIGKGYPGRVKELKPFPAPDMDVKLNSLKTLFFAKTLHTSTVLDIPTLSEDPLRLGPSTDSRSFEMLTGNQPNRQHNSISCDMIIYICYARHTFRVSMERLKSMNYTPQIIDEVCRLRKMGVSIPKVAHALARSYPRYCKTFRKQKNIAGPDVLQIIDILKNQERLPRSGLDSLKTKIGEKGRFKSNLTKPPQKEVATSPRFF